ncbi:MAG TPA: uracil-DNA glycosylase [Clostridia bacterium]|nr:uracil-DNA glycosylase [Clostridia bacterium]
MADEQTKKENAEVSLQLELLYAFERERLGRLAALDQPQGEYAHPVFGEGSAHAKVLLIGEAPGAEETKHGRPFVGKAGKQLDELFHLFGISRENAYITNVVKYRPCVRSPRSVRNRTPVPSEVEASLPLLQKELELIRPDFLCTLGNTPLKAVYRLSGEKPEVVGNVHGRQIPLTVGGVSFSLIPLYHPASGIYNRALIEVMREDAEKVHAAIANKT